MSQPRGAASPAGGARLVFIDNIRWVMIVLVLSMHACVTYSPFGSWFYRDREPMGFASMVSFAVYQSWLQAFFMALLFFIAGYFAAASCDRKDTRRFLRDRLIRLGLPTLAFMLAIGPLTEYFVSRSWGRGGFVHQWLRHAADGEILSETGPLWFCLALLIFCAAYGGFRAAGWVEPRLEPRGGWRGSLFAAGFIAVMAMATFAVRLVFPSGSAVLNMQLANFSQYVLAFAVGLLAFRGGWLGGLPGRFGAAWGIGAALVGGPLFVALILWGGARDGDTHAYSGGLNWVSAGMCLWESLVCVGVSLGVIAGFRRWFNTQGRSARWMSDNAFGVYVIHPPILIALTLLLRELTLPPLSKAALLTLCAALVCFGLAAPLLRRTPLLRAIV